MVRIAVLEAPPLARETADGFAVPQTGWEFSLPRDHGSHPDFRVEWWYVTGHLFSQDRRFGFQATFFRRATGPYDLVLFGLLDSHLSTFSSVSSNIRVDNYVYTVEAFRSALDRLTPQGILVSQSESPFDRAFQGSIRQANELLARLFGQAYTYLAFIPTYPLGMWSFMMASPQLHPLDDYDAEEAARRLAPFAGEICCTAAPMRRDVRSFTSTKAVPLGYSRQKSTRLRSWP